jgi:putative membrane protein
VSMIGNVFVGLVALLHSYFLILEMFLWDKPTGLRVFGMTPEKAAISKTLAANQGLYNGFLVAGLVWALLRGAEGKDLKIFFLGCVIVAGLFGAITVSKRILFVQAVPAIIALVLTLLG